MSAYIVYSLIAKVYGKEGIMVVDYFETSNYYKALETFDDMLTEANANNYGFAGICEVVLTKTQCDSNGKAIKSNYYKVRVNKEEGYL